MKDNRARELDSLPYRGTFGAPRPGELAALPLPPLPMPGRAGLRPLKAWRYVGVFGSELMLCVAAVRVGPARQAFWAVWDRASAQLRERTALGRGGVDLDRGRVSVLDEEIGIDLRLQEEAGIETVSRSGDSYAWTRKQGGIRAHGTVNLAGSLLAVDAAAIVDDTAGYYPRHTSWCWAAGVGRTRDGRPAAWNLVDGVHDAPTNSERTVWIAGEATEADPVRFAEDLTSVGSLCFAAEATRERDENLLIVRSSYRQPFGTFSGRLPDGSELAEGFGVMEAHDARW